MSRELYVVVNPHAGTAEDEAMTQAMRVWDGAGVRVRRIDAASADELAAACAGIQGQPVVVVGGDGSLHAVAAVLYRQGDLRSTPLGLVPMGTGNDIAGGSGLPSDPGAAAERVLRGSPRPVDLLVDDTGSGLALNTVNVGIGAAAAERAVPLKPALGAIGYAVGAISAGTNEPGWALGLVVDGHVLVEPGTPVLHIVIGNGSTLGGGTVTNPDADPTDSRADVMVSTAVGPLERVAYAQNLTQGTHLQRPDVFQVRGCRVEITGDEHPWNADGETGADRARSVWEVRPDGWQLIC